MVPSLRSRNLKPLCQPSLRTIPPCKEKPNACDGGDRVGACQSISNSDGRDRVGACQLISIEILYGWRPSIFRSLDDCSCPVLPSTMRCRPSYHTSLAHRKRSRLLVDGKRLAFLCPERLVLSLKPASSFLVGNQIANVLWKFSLYVALTKAMAFI